MTSSGFSYPHFVSYGYTSCSTCHYNAYGNGPLTDYGRAVSAVAIAAVPFYNGEKDPEKRDEKLGGQSGFLGDPEALPSWLRLSLGLRGLYMVNAIKDAGKNRFIPMQADGSVILQSKRLDWVGVATFGYAPPPASLSEAEASVRAKLISREHYVSFRGRSFEVYLGMMDVVFGTRLADHIAYSREKTALAMNDQTHGLVFRYHFDDWDFAVHPFVGNFFQDRELRQRGVSLRIERNMGEVSLLGISALASMNRFRARQMVAVHLAAQMIKGSSALVEMGFIREDPFSAQAKIGKYIFFQNSVGLARGFNLLGTAEYYTEEAYSSSPSLIRITPALQYFPMQRVELRIDFQAARAFGETNVNEDLYALLTQVHLWF